MSRVVCGRGPCGQLPGRYCGGRDLRLDRRRERGRRGKEDQQVPGKRRESLSSETGAVLLATHDEGRRARLAGGEPGLQQIMNDYAGTAVRSETLLTAGLKY